MDFRSPNTFTRHQGLNNRSAVGALKTNNSFNISFQFIMQLCGCIEIIQARRRRSCGNRDHNRHVIHDISENNLFQELHKPLWVQRVRTMLYAISFPRPRLMADIITDHFIDYIPSLWTFASAGGLILGTAMPRCRQ